MTSKTSITCFVLGLSMTGALVGCSNDGEGPSTAAPTNSTPIEFGVDGDRFGVAEGALDGTLRSSAGVYRFESHKPAGVSTLVRDESGILAQLSAKGLDYGETATMWWVVFNNPEACENEPCAMPDLFIPEVEADILYAAGNVVGTNSWIAPNGTAFIGALAPGDTEGSVKDVFELPAASGLIDPMKAEVHLVIRSHEDAIPGDLYDQISSFNGGCEPGDANEGLCNDKLYSVHMAKARVQ